ncbi:hypothetical protein DKX38_024591 [Salix brachista]|uniref:Uncharacterized protein n=1 Tax=Salix brachista TaxID=2182728 RepID=A0A5N5JMM6_9ROSI|nr:hypothetical protein DKX38_024591 [Salix brachista]
MNPRDAGQRDVDVDMWAAIDEQRQAMARLEAMVQRLVDHPPVPVDRGIINQPAARQQPRIARNRACDDSSDEDSEGEIAGAPENQQQRRNQPEYQIPSSRSLHYRSMGETNFRGKLPTLEGQNPPKPTSNHTQTLQGASSSHNPAGNRAAAAGKEIS